MDPQYQASPAAIVFIALIMAFALVVEVMICVLLVRTVWRRQPKSIEAWAAEAVQVSLRVPATGALYAAGVLAYLWFRARL